MTRPGWVWRISSSTRTSRRWWMTETRSRTEEILEKVALQQEVQDFLFLEARLLDERRLTEWLDLLAEDLHYFMPIRRNIKFGDWDLEYSDPESEISYFDEGKDILTGRVRQINTGVHCAEEPVSRFEHLIPNVEILNDEGDTGEVPSKFYTYQNR